MIHDRFIPELLMQSLSDARREARRVRALLDTSLDDLLRRVTEYLWTQFDLDASAVPAAAIRGSRAELRVAERCVLYDEALDADPITKLFVLAHELGHLILHPRVQHRVARTDPVLGSAYLTEGAGAIARYSRKMREEAEANAFATEFLCPSDAVFASWRTRPECAAQEIAAELGLPVYLVRTQLAEALYLHAVGENGGEPDRGLPERIPDAVQQAASECTGVPVLLSAGPGTGKTATLIERIGHILKDRENRPEQILVLTFSDDAAREIRTRVVNLYRPEIAREIEIATFHGFGLQFLRLHGQFAGVSPDALVIDESVQQERISELLGTVGGERILNLVRPEETAEAVVSHISYLKDRGITVPAFADAIDAWEQERGPEEGVGKARELLSLYAAYEEENRRRETVDFSDLILLPLVILRSHEPVRSAYREKYRWVLVDEYQDVGRSVAELLVQLCGAENPPWVVGDMRQAIYRFRGAHPENMEEFESLFANARRFELERNHRSCEAVVTAANQLATLIAAPAHADGSFRQRWRSAYGDLPIGEVPVRIAAAASDAAEHAGIVREIETWREEVRLGDIAVLARRNIDVRNIVLALGKHGIRATTAGLITAEGAAGDLAAVLTLADHAKASFPRVLVALGRDRYPSALLNRAVEIFRSADDIIEVATDETPAELVDEIRRALSLAAGERFESDGFAALTAFLFDGSDYLRRVLAMQPGAERDLVLGEIVTVLSLAAGYRFTHPDVRPRQGRIGFAEHLRAKLTAGLSSVVPSRETPDAVRVMTCHASKGLEFPCVVVAGQTLSLAPGGYPWLPDALRPSSADERAQADALLFVGVTRAKRAVLVSFANSRSGGRGRQREVTPLLARWRQHYRIPSATWDVGPRVRDEVTTHGIWGGGPPSDLAARALDAGTCPLQTYIEDVLRARLPTVRRAMYPVFVVRLRETLRRAGVRSQELGRSLTELESRALFDEVWPANDELGDHPHFALYRARAAESVLLFGRTYVPEPEPVAFLDPNLGFSEVAGSPAVRLDLIAHYRRADGTVLAMLLHVPSLARALNKDRTAVLWNKLSSARRLPLVLLRRLHAQLEPWVYSVTDGVAYRFQWSIRGDSMEREATVGVERLTSLTAARYKTLIDEWTCDRCGSRVLCPYWMDVLE